MSTNWLITPPILRVFRRCVVQPNGCLTWSGHVNADGYGKVKLLDGAHTAAGVHRVAYEHAKGPIPAGFQVDHLCRNTRCCNPAHLEAVTGRVNTLRGDTLPARNAAKTHCPQGHAYNAENTRWNNNKRYCRVCQNTRAREYRQRLASRTSTTQERNHA